MKAQNTTKILSSFLVSSILIASITLTSIGIKIENTGLILIGFVAILMSFYLEFLLISYEQSKISREKKNSRFSSKMDSNEDYSKAGIETIQLGLPENHAA